MKKSLTILKTKPVERPFSAIRCRIWLVSVFLASCVVLAAKAQISVYDNLSTAPTAGFGDLNANNPIFGDSLNLSQSGPLSRIGLTLYNPNNADNTGAILTGSMVINFYDNTVPYAGGALNNPLLGSATVTWDFTGIGGLLPGFFAPNTYDLTSFNINLPQHVLVTQQFTETSGSSIRNGAALLSNPTIGSSPNTVYLKTSAIPQGMYTVGGNPGQFGYQIQIVPEPDAVALATLGASALLMLRRRK